MILLLWADNGRSELEIKENMNGQNYTLQHKTLLTSRDYNNALKLEMLCIFNSVILCRNLDKVKLRSGGDDKQKNSSHFTDTKTSNLELPCVDCTNSKSQGKWEVERGHCPGTSVSTEFLPVGGRSPLPWM